VVTVIVQVNGKLRDRLEVAPGTPADELVALARARPKVASAAEGKRVVREVVVPDKLVNLVMK
jgi:leucyl-tRNA synthetase